MDYQPVSSGIEDGCVAWVNDDYNELMVVTVTIDLQGTYNINKIRYNMGNCQRAETWNADIMESPFGRTPTNLGTPYSGAWTEQTGDITASNVTIKFEKTRTVWERDWLFIGEIEVWGTPVETSEFEFIHLTDVHIGKPNMVEIFSRTINEINILKDNPNTKLRFILLTGDFVENNSNSRREVEAETYYKEFDDLLKSLDPSIPVYIVPGNHERYTHKWFGDDNLESYHKYIKYPPDASILIEKDNYTFNYGGYLLIGLDSGTVTDESGISSGLTDDQLNELENLNKDLPKIIFMHVPAINIPSEKGVIGNNRERFINYCKLNNAQIVLTGHTHRDMVLTPDGYQVDVHSSIRPLFIQTRSVDCTNRNISGFRQIKANNTGVFPYWSNVLYTSPPTIKAFVESPVDLHAYDSQGRHTGVNYTNTERNIPQSFYIRYSGDTPQTIILYNTSDNYSFEIVSNFTTQQQMKSLEVESFNFTVEQRTTDYLTTIHYYNVSITQNTTAILPINLTTTNYTMLVDTDGDGETDETKDLDSIEINYAPTATIVSPENGSIYNESETIEFNGTGTDPEDGVLANSSLLWTSDIDGVIGVGNRFSTTNLSVGTHTVTLMVNDSGGLTDIQSITLTVNEIASPKTIYVDFFVTGDSSGNVYVFPSYGNGSFADKELIGNIESGCLGSAIADFDNDGDLDLTIQSKWGDSYLFINDGTGGFAQTKVAEGLALSEYSGESTTADFNNDGYYDYVVSSSGAYIYLFTYNKNNTFSKSTINAEWLVTGSGLNFLSGIDTGDFNEDGNMDFLIAEYREYGTDLVYLYIGNGDGTFTYKFAFDNIDYKGGDTRAVVAGDFDNDGHCDAIVGQDDDGEPGQTWLYKGDGTGNFTYFGEAYDTNPSIESGGEYSGAGYADAYDFDGDGNLDVVANAKPYGGGGDSGTFFFRGNGNGTFRAPIKVDEFIGRGISAPPLEVKPEILVFDTGEGTYPSIMGNHTGIIIPNQTINVSKLYTYPCSGTGGHAEYARIYNDSWGIETLPWEGYGGDWYNLSFTEPFKLYVDEEYKFTIITGSYPQIHHNTSLLTPNGRINCTKFTDANGRVYYDWIPAIRFFW
ncbi:hypothetical protein CW713_03185 [Methanophagales archaeon]|nr:MAG: hypothetical protein CW713_03185 [Methanophagales archaeon]